MLSIRACWLLQLYVISLVLKPAQTEQCFEQTRHICTGIYVGFGSFLAFTVGGNLAEMAAHNPGLQKFLYGAIGLPAGLVMVHALLTACLRR